jgi:type II secretory pathway component PulF
MSVSQSKIGLCVLQWSLGIVILIEAVMFVLPSAAHEFSRTHMPGIVRMILGWGEIAGAVLLLIPKTVIRGAWLLLAVFVMAILLHLLHGLYGIGNLVVYAAAAFAIAGGKN